MAKTEPVVLTKEQAGWIKEMREVKDDYDIIDEVLVGRAPCEILSLGIPKLTQALYVGYKTGKTQEERRADVKELFDSLDHPACNPYKRVLHKQIIQGTLDRLDIFIEGVNA